MRKVAICISGETRTFNTKSYQELKTLTEKLSVRGFEFDFYGHTWDHCEDPDPSLLPFKKIIKEPLSIIDKWVMAEFLTRAFFDRKYPIKVSQRQDPEKIVDFYLQASRAGYGQLISAFNCFKLIDIDQYDLVIRARWDCKFKDLDIAYVIETLVSQMNKAQVAAENNSPLVLASSDTRIMPYSASKKYVRQPAISLGDLFFVFNKFSFTSIMNKPVFTIIEHINDSTTKTHHNFRNHQLWSEILLRCDIYIDTTLPNIFETHRTPGDEMKSISGWSAN
jgi:hypothetical protein